MNKKEDRECKKLANDIKNKFAELGPLIKEAHQKGLLITLQSGSDFLTIRPCSVTKVQSITYTKSF